MLSELLLSRDIGMNDSLIRVGGAAKDDGAVAIGFEFGDRRVLRRAQGGQEFLLVPLTDEDIVAPFRVGVSNTIRLKFGRKLVGTGTRDITEAAGVAAADRGVAGPVGEGFVFEVVGRNDQWLTPEVGLVAAGLEGDGHTASALGFFRKLSHSCERRSSEASTYSC